METKFDYCNSVCVNVEDMEEFLCYYDYKEAFVVEKLGLCYIISFSNSEDLEHAKEAINFLYPELEENR